MSTDFIIVMATKLSGFFSIFANDSSVNVCLCACQLKPSEKTRYWFTLNSV